MRTSARNFLFALAGMLLLAGPAWAGQREGAFTLSPMVGYHVFEGDQRTDNHASLGLAIGYNLTKHWAFEADLRYTPTGTTPRTGQNDKDVTVWTGSLNALYHFMPDGAFVPYLAAGLGGMFFNVDDRGIGGDDHDFMLNAGAGVKYFFSDDLALRLDARYVADMNPDRNYDQNFGSDDFDHNLIAMAGLVWQFGAPTPAPAPAPAPAPVQKPEPVVETPAPAPPPAPAPAPAPAPVVVPEKKKEIITFNLLFDFDKATIKEDMIPQLEQAKKILNEDPEATFTVSGHTCSIGTDAYNQKLSERRAAAVKGWLVNNGIGAARLEEVGYGEARPKYDNGTMEGRKLNRRVEIVTK